MLAGLAASISVLAFFGPGMPSAHAQERACYPAPTEAQRQEANKLAEAAYEMHKELRYDETAALYVRALEHMRDPRLYLQAGIAFFNAMRLLEAYEHLLEAVRCGQTVLQPEQIAEAERKLRVLRARLGQLSVACDTPGAEVRLNDEPWFSCTEGLAARRANKRMVVAGQYVVAVNKDGHVPVLKPVTVSPREHVQVTPTVMSVAEATVQTRRWPTWQPWAVAGAGLALGAIGGGLRWYAGARHADSEKALSEDCYDDDGCSSAISQDLFNQQESAVTQSRVALGMLTVGAAALAGGLAWAFFNRPSTSTNPDAGKAEIQVVPTAGATGGGVSLYMRF